MAEHARDKKSYKWVFCEKGRLNSGKKVLNSAISFRGVEGRYTRVTDEEIGLGNRGGKGGLTAESGGNWGISGHGQMHFTICPLKKNSNRFVP